MVASHRSVRRYTAQNIDVLLAIAGSVCFTAVGLVLLSKVYPLYGLSSLLAGLACLVYLPLRKRLAFIEQSGKALYYDVLWIIIFVGGLVSYVLRPDQYVRPLWFYVLISVAVGVVTLKILACKMGKREVAITLGQAIAIGLCLEWTVTLMYPTVVGLDPWTHRQQTMRILNGGYIAWYSFPGMYYLVAGVMKVTGLEYRYAAMAISFIQVAGDATTVLLLGKWVKNVRTGLLAAVVVSFSSWHIFFGYWTIPNALAATLMLVAVCLMVKSRKAWTIPVAGVLVAALALTHLMAAGWMVALAIIWLACMLVMARNKIAKPLIWAGSVSIAVLAVWLQSGFINVLRTFISRRFNPGVFGFTELPGLAPATMSGNDVALDIVLPKADMYVNTLTMTGWEPLFNASGMVLGFAIAIIGCLWLLKKNNITPLSLFVVAAFALFMIGGIVPALFGMSLIEHRWWYMAQIFGAISIAVLLVAVPQRWIVVAGAMGLCFLMIMGLPSNMDNDTFSKNQLVRYALTRGELEAIESVMTDYDGTVGVDAYYNYASHYMPEYRQRFVNINTAYLSGDFRNVPSEIVMVRDAVAYKPFAFGEGHIYKLQYDPNAVLPQQGFKMILNTPEVKGYVRR